MISSPSRLTALEDRRGITNILLRLMTTFEPPEVTNTSFIALGGGKSGAGFYVVFPSLPKAEVLVNPLLRRVLEPGVRYRLHQVGLVEWEEVELASEAYFVTLGGRRTHIPRRLMYLPFDIKLLSDDEVTRNFRFHREHLPLLKDCFQAIAGKGAPMLNCWGFTDGTCRHTCRPTINQENYYSRHKRYHCIKFQSTVTPDGLIINLLGPFEGRRHDAVDPAFIMTTYMIGDLVWAKMKGFPKWPGIVAEPTKELEIKKKASNSHCIFFFGTNNYAWIEPKGLAPYNKPPEMETKSRTFKHALAAIEHCKLTGEGGPEWEETSDPFDQLMQPSASNTNKTIPADKKKSVTRKRKISKDGREAASTDVDSLEDEPRQASKSLKVRGPTKSLDTPKGRTPRKSGDGSLGKRRKKTENLAADTTTDDKTTSNRKSLLDRPTLIQRAETPLLDLHTVSNALLSKSIIPSDKSFGFIGLGIMGRGIVKNLLNSNHEVFVWDRNPEKSQEFVRIGAKLQRTPSDVVSMADITFSCVSDSSASKELVFGDCGVLSVMDHTKAFIEMSGIDPETSQTIAVAISQFGGKYLEAMLIGSKAEADEGTLTILAAGDLPVFNDARSCFQAMGRVSIFLGEVGSATKMNLIHKMFMGTFLASLAEAMALADRAGLNHAEVLEFLNHSKVWSPLLADTGKAVADCAFGTHFPLRHLQKDLRLVEGVSESLDHPVPITSAAHEMYKRAKCIGYGDDDAAAVYMSSRF